MLEDWSEHAPILEQKQELFRRVNRRDLGKQECTHPHRFVHIYTTQLSCRNLELAPCWVQRVFYHLEDASDICLVCFLHKPSV